MREFLRNWDVEANSTYTKMRSWCLINKLNYFPLAFLRGVVFVYTLRYYVVSIGGTLDPCSFNWKRHINITILFVYPLTTRNLENQTCILFVHVLGLDVSISGWWWKIDLKYITLQIIHTCRGNDQRPNNCELGSNRCQLQWE